jgi:hypothetical protein
MQQSGAYRLPDKEAVHYTFPKPQQAKAISIERGHKTLVIITQLSRGNSTWNEESTPFKKTETKTQR